MRIWALVAILGLSGCSAMGTALFGPAPAADPAAEQEAQTAASAAAPEQRKPRKVNPITGEIVGQSELDRALQRLVDDLELAVTRLPSGRARGRDASGPGGTHVVQEGEYLDLIIEKTIPGSPIRKDLLRKAFVKLNPSAFGGRGNPNYIFARKKLKVPSVEDLKAVIFNAGELEQLRSNSADPHQGWIQYP